MNIKFSIAVVTLCRGRCTARKNCAIQAALILGCLLGQSCPAQTYIFESPNTREHMSDESAMQSLDSYEQRNFLAVAGYLAARLCTHPTIQGGLGVFAGNTENTAMVHGCAGSRARYLGELLARYAHQEWVLIFSADAGESERLVIVSFSSNELRGTPAEIRRFGLAAGTVLIDGRLVRIYFWQTDHAQDQAIRALAEAHQATVKEITGKGTLIGSNARAEAQKLFDRDIAAYERRHHWKLSALLWTRRLHDLGMEKRGSM